MKRPEETAAGAITGLPRERLKEPVRSSMLTRKEIAVILGIGILFGLMWLIREARKDEGFLWISTRRVTRIMVDQTIPEALERFEKDVGRYPSTAEGLSALLHAPEGLQSTWRGLYVDWPGRFPVDAWGHLYRYCSPAKRSAAGFEVWSLGQDGYPSDDDTGNWTK